MTLNAKDAPSIGPRTPPLESGTYPGRLVMALDMGLQPQRPWQGKEKPDAHEIMLTWEFVDEFMLDEDGQPQEDKPRWLSESMVLYSLEAEKAKSTKRYNALDPTGDAEGDFTLLLDTPVDITVIQNPSKNGKVYANIAAVSPMRKKRAATCPPLVNEAKAFDLSNPNMEVFHSLPDWIKKKIESNLEFEGSKLETLLNKEEKSKPPKNSDVTQSDEEEETPY